jgi:putative tricarboxylic transport membrane protein
MISTVGTDPVTGLSRFTFGSPELLSGIPPILVMVGTLYSTSIWLMNMIRKMMWSGWTLIPLRLQKLFSVSPMK